jgi:hypothetical protein
VVEDHVDGHGLMISNDPQDVILVAIEILFLFLSYRLSDLCDVLFVDAALPGSVLASAVISLRVKPVPDMLAGPLAPSGHLSCYLVLLG